MHMMTRFWEDLFQGETTHDHWWGRKKKLMEERGTEIVRINGKGQVFQKVKYDDQEIYHYLLHLSFLMNQGDFFYIEETVVPYHFQIRNGKITEHKEIRSHPDKRHSIATFTDNDVVNDKHQQRFTYDRLAAVKYAELWWNSYNPDYRAFDVDCTNYVSQCLRAGGAPMHGMPNQSNGWWYQGDKWSFSWAVAHSLRWYLSGSTEGLRGKEVESPLDLYPGDVICYDFQGDGRWDHNTIVVTKDADGMPLVNAHTDNSRNRYWSYEDSTAWTPEIKYKFFQIGM